MKAGVGFSEDKSTAKAIEKACRAALENGAIEKPSFGMVFSTIDHAVHHDKLLTSVRGIVGDIPFAGASGFGIFTHEAETERSSGVAALFVESQKLHASSFLVSNLQENNFMAGRRIGQAVKTRLERKSLLTIFPDALSLFSESVFRGIQEEIGNVSIVGGSAGEDGSENKTFQWSDQGAGCDSVSGMCLTGEFSAVIGVAHSCKPIGEPLQVTKADGNYILELSSRPALDVVTELLNYLKIDDLEKALSFIFVGIPIMADNEETSDFLIRNILGVNVEEKGIAIGRPVQEGDYIFFALREPSLARQNMEDLLKKMRPEAKKRKPSFGLYFNCCARGKSLYGQADIDRSLIRKELGQFPMAGFFTYGEVAPIGQRNYLHNFTGILVLIGD